MDYTTRRQHLQQLLGAAAEPDPDADPGADAIAIVPGANLKYFTGLDYHLSERPIIALFTGHELSLIVPELEVPQVSARPDLEVRLFTWTDTDGYQGAFNVAVEALGLRGKTLGVDDATMRLFEWLAFLEADPTMKLEEFGKALLKIRAQKGSDELDAMRYAIRLSEQALDQVLRQVKPGMTERDIATRLDQELLSLGSQGLAFKSLVQTGPNSALPHGGVTDRVLQPDELLLIDFGGLYQNYPADITRTFCVGTPSAEIQRIYDTVLAANRAAIAAAGPGVECGVVDAAARQVITAAGYGDYFIHRTGHGLGLEVHELPQMAAGVEDELKPGMVFTVEPGIYVPGVGGVRIEDNVLVTETGVDVLTSYRRELTV